MECWRIVIGDLGGVGVFVYGVFDGVLGVCFVFVGFAFVG